MRHDQASSGIGANNCSCARLLSTRGRRSNPKQIEEKSHAQVSNFDLDSDRVSKCDRDGNRDGDGIPRLGLKLISALTPILKDFLTFNPNMASASITVGGLFGVPSTVVNRMTTDATQMSIPTPTMRAPI